MGITTKYKGKTVKNNYLRLDFRNMSSATVYFEIALKDGITAAMCKDVEWRIYYNDDRVEVYDNYNRLDKDDYTGGQKAELILYKDQAGAIDAPFRISIQALKPDSSVIDKVIIDLFDEPVITQAGWFGAGSTKEITEANFSDIVEVSLDGEGIFGINLDVAIHLSKDDQQLERFTLVKDRTVNRVFLKKTWNTGNSNCLFAGEAVYFVVSYDGQEGKKVLFNGKEQGKQLTIKGRCFENPKLLSMGMMNVSVGREEYFTQRYEPCKYETITYTFGDQQEITVFDEKQQPVATPYQQPSANIKVGAHKKPFKIKVTGHDPNTKCSAVEQGEEAHTCRIIDPKAIPTITSYTGDTLEFTPYYPYKYHTPEGLPYNDYLNFLLEYFIPPNATKLSIPIKTCRYAKTLYLTINPDIAWALHFQLMPYPSVLEEKPEEFQIADKKEMYFREIATISLHHGIDKLIDKYREDIERVGSYFVLPAIPTISPLFSLKEFVISFVVDYIETLGSCMAIGLHAYYNEDGDCREIADYTARYPQIGNVIFSVIIVTLIVIEILILILSGGTYAAARAGIKVSGKVIKIVKKLQYTQDTYQWIQRKTEHSIFYIAWPIISEARGKGYRIYPDGSSGYHYEIKLTACPIFGVMIKFHNHAGHFILNATGISTLFTVARTMVGLWGKIITHKLFKENKKISRKSFSLTRQKNPDWSASSIVSGKTPKQLEDRPLITPGDIIVILNRVEDNLAEKARQIAKELGQELEYYLSVEGVYKAQYKVDINIPDEGAPFLEMTNKLPDEEIVTNSLKNNKKTVSFSRKKSIDAYVFVKASSKFTFFTDWIAPYVPEWLGVKKKDFKSKKAETKITVEGKVKAMLQGGIAFERVYGIDNDLNPYYQEITHFSGIAGRYKYSFKGKKKEKKKDKSNEEEKSIEIKGGSPQLIIFQPFDTEGKKVYLFKKEDVEKGL